jgi:CSLREA domain-containing protein
MMKVLRSFILVCVFFGFIFPLGIANSDTTTKITVNSFFDVLDTGDQLCTLREAIIAANNNQPSGVVKGECPAGNLIGSDTIVVPAGTYTLTITGQGEDDGLQGDLDITSSMTIQGVGPNTTIIQAGTTTDNSVDRVFHVNTAGSVHFEGLTIQHGKSPDSSPVGGGIFIQNNGTISIDNCIISHNELQTDLIGGGGGIANTGSANLSIINSAISSNYAMGTGAVFGGGIHNATGIINIANTTFVSNRSFGSGGALSNFGTAYLSNVTMTSNWSDFNSDGSGDGGGIAGSGITYLKNSLLWNVDSVVIDGYPNISGNVLSADYNIIVDIGDEQGFAPAEHDIVGDDENEVDPDIGQYIQSSGSHQLLSTSLVLDQIPVTSCTYLSGGSNPLFSNGEAITRDQRGASRPSGSHCDIGAREFYSLAVTSTEDTLADDGECSLREAITTANTGESSGQTDGECDIPPDRVDLPAGTYTLAIAGTGEENNQTGDLNLHTDLILSGAGADNTILQAGPSPGSGIDRVIRSHSFGTLEIRDLTIQNGQTSSHGAGIYATNQTIMLIEGSIENNVAELRGGGICCDGFCDTVILGSAIIGNQSQTSNGGGIYVPESILTIANSTIANNQAAGSGGGIYGSRALYLSNATVISNTADSDQDGVGDGGGIYFYPDLVLKNSIIASNVDWGRERPDISHEEEEFYSLDYNLIGDIGTQLFEGAAHDIVGTSSSPVDPQLGELTGKPAYQVPEPYSPVIDAIPTNKCTYTSPDSNKLFSDGEAIISDQTGEDRPLDGDMDGNLACDIGAVEYRQPPFTTVFLPLVVND